jgi:hypothetical protein
MKKKSSAPLCILAATWSIAIVMDMVERNTGGHEYVYSVRLALI